MYRDMSFCVILALWKTFVKMPVVQQAVTNIGDELFKLYGYFIMHQTDEEERKPLLKKYVQKSNHVGCVGCGPCSDST